MRFNFKSLFAHGPEAIQADHVFVRKLPLEELGLTILYIVFGGMWCVFSDDLLNWLMGVPLDSPGLQTMKGINFLLTTALVLYVVLRRTINRRRLAEEALRLSQQRFESAALATTDAIWDLNLENKVVWWSEGVQKLFGYRPEEVSSKFEWWLQRVHPDDRQKVTESIQHVVDGGGNTWSGEYRFRRQEGTYASVLDRGYIIHDADGKPTRLVGGISDVSERRMAEKALQNSRQQLRALTARLQSGREEERATVAREIHDDLGQTLTALKLNLDWLERKLSEREGDVALNPLLDRVLESEEIVETATQSVQRIATELRPASLDHLGLSEALTEEARRFEQRSGITCKLQLPPEPLNLSSETSTAIFRVFQEALTNVARHAQATDVNICFGIHEQHLELQLEDNGKGIAPETIAAPNSLGLLGMTERAAQLGGYVAVAPIEPHGTRVTLQLPRRPNVASATAGL